MSNLEHLLENGLIKIIAGLNPEEWHDVMIKDPNWKSDVHITIDDLWTICQYVIFTWDEKIA